MYTVMHAFERDRLLELLQGSLLPLASIVLSFVLAWGLGRLCRVDGRHFGLFCASVAHSNTIADAPPLMGRVFVIQASLPVVAQAAVLSAQFRTDAAFGAQAVALSTLLSIVTVPLLMALL